MHELGIVKYIAKTVKQTAEENQAEKVAGVVLEVGEVSGILPDYLTDCWNYFRVRTPGLEEAELKLVTIPAVTWCEDCEDTYETVKYGRTCPYCRGGRTWLLQGNETRIREIEVP